MSIKIEEVIDNVTRVKFDVAKYEPLWKRFSLLADIFNREYVKYNYQLVFNECCLSIHKYEDRVDVIKTCIGSFASLLIKDDDNDDYIMYKDEKLNSWTSRDEQTDGISKIDKFLFGGHSYGIGVSILEIFAIFYRNIWGICGENIYDGQFEDDYEHKYTIARAWILPKQLPEQSEIQDIKKPNINLIDIVTKFRYISDQLKKPENKFINDINFKLIFCGD